MTTFKPGREGGGVAAHADTTGQHRNRRFGLRLLGVFANIRCRRSEAKRLGRFDRLR